jgi:polyketide biosynthesis enoyl-CoA hydratase PksH
MSTYSTIRIEESGVAWTVTINRPERQNSIDGLLLQELHSAFDHMEEDRQCRIAIIAGHPGFFCTGMDFQEAVGQTGSNDDAEKADAFIRLLRKMSMTSKIVIASIDGKVNAGGIGLVAASDFAVATPQSQFSLSEAIWGLLPACVVPYLIRRTGFQPAYWMTLSTLPVSAAEAQAFRLINEVSADPASVVQRLMPRLARLDGQTIVDIKAYFRKMWLVNDEMEQVAVKEITRLMSEPRVRENIRGFVEHQRFPWSPR